MFLFFHFFFFNDTATTEIYTLSLHDALPIFSVDTLVLGITGGWYPPELRFLLCRRLDLERDCAVAGGQANLLRARHTDRKSTRLNSSHANISYAVFCLKKKKK